MRFLKKMGLTLIAALIILLIIGYIYEEISAKKDTKTYKPVGELYDVGNKKMHLYTGGNGDVTVVFAAGWGTVNPYVDFYPLYDEIAKHAKFAVYDRFGYGYSDMTDEERDIDLIVDEIHELLHKSGQKPPYILVGHSLASLETVRYAQKYEDEVKGIVLIDGGNPELYAANTPITFIGILQRELIRFGAARILYKIDAFANSINSERNQLTLLPDELKDLDKTSTLLQGSNINVIDEMRRSQENAQKVVNGGKIQNIPLTVITSGDFGKASKEWLDSQETLKEWSNYGKQFVVEETKHYIHHYQPEIIVEEIVELIK